MTLVREDPRQIEHEGTHVLFEEARQRRRRLRVLGTIVALCVATLLAVLGAGIYILQPAVTGSHPSGAPKLLNGRSRTGATLVYSFSNLRVINADTGTSRILPLPAPEGGSSDRDMVRIGDSLLLNRDNTAWLYRSNLHGKPVDLGPSQRIMPGPTANEVWLWSSTCVEAAGCSRDPNRFQGDVRLVDFSGHQIGLPIPLPAGVPGWFPTGDVVDGALVLANVYGPVDGERVWDPASNRFVLNFPDGGVIGAQGDLVAWTTNPSCLPKCTVHLTNAWTGVERDLALPTGAVGAGAAFSPDGAILAVQIALSAGGSGRHPTAVALFNLRTWAVSVLPGSEQKASNWGVFTAGWSRTGWLFFTAFGDTRVRAWHPGDSRAVVLPKARIPPFPPPGAEGQQLPTLIAL